MARKYRGMQEDLLGYYSHWNVEDVQMLTSGWFDAPLYAGWESMENYADTKECRGW